MGDMQRRKAYLHRRVNDMNADFQTYRETARDLRDFILPYTGRDLDEQGARQETDGRKRMSYIYDSSATDDAESFGAAIQTNSMSPSLPWFSLGAGDPTTADLYTVREWIDEVERRFYAVLRGSNIYQAVRPGMTELPIYGTWAMALLESDDSIIRAIPHTFGEYRIAQSDAGIVDVFYRKTNRTLRQIVQRYGLENLNEKMQDAYKHGRLETYYTVEYLIEPNDQDAMPFPDAPNKPFRAITWIDQGGYVELATEGFDEFPIMVPRYARVGNAVYGYGVGHIILPDVMELQLTSKDRRMVAEQIARPSMLSIGMKASDFDLNANGINIGDQGSDLKPAYTPNAQAYTVLTDAIERLQSKIRRTMHVDLFRQLIDSDRRQMTAAEVHERTSQAMALLGPLAEALTNELHDPIISRVFGIMQRRGLLPPAPSELQGKPLTVQYISPLARAQRMLNINASDRFVAFVGATAGLKPDVLDGVDFDSLVKGYANDLGMENKTMIGDDQVQAMREQRAQVQQQAQQAAIQNQQAMAAKNSAQAQAVTTDQLIGGLTGG